MTIYLSHPPQECSPNARCHWAVKARATRKYRYQCGVAALVDSHGVRPKWKRATVLIRAFFKDRRRRDVDNFIASMKAGLDALQDAWIVENDSGLVWLPPEILVDKQRPRVEIEVLEA